MDKKTASNGPWQPQFNRQDVEVLDDLLIAESFYQLRELNVRHRSFGGESISVKRDLIDKPNVVAVLLYDAARDTVVMVEQFRIGALGQSKSPWLLEVVAGIVEPNENIESVAARECFEETGLKIQGLEHIYKFTPSPGGVREYIDLFCANIDSTIAGGVYGLAEEGEDIKVHVLPAAVAFSMLKSGEIDNAIAIIALQWLQLNSQKIG